MTKIELEIIKALTMFMKEQKVAWFEGGGVKVNFSPDFEIPKDKPVSSEETDDKALFWSSE